MAEEPPKHGHVVLGSNPQLRGREFFIAEVEDGAMEKGRLLKGPQLKILFVSVHGFLADIFATLGIARKENAEGKDVLLVTKPDAKIRFKDQ